LQSLLVVHGQLFELGTQTPAWQRSPWVHEMPSSQDAPSAFAGVEQRPVAGSHCPAS
jgi:hypothetical protein